MTTEPWQLYDLHGHAIMSAGGQRQDVVLQGLLHGSAHVWIWRHKGQEVELLLQQKARGKINWPERYDKSAGGHILFGEQPLSAARRKAGEELGLGIHSRALEFIGVTRWCMPLENTGFIENELQWIYVYEHDDPVVSLASKEVAAVHWMKLQDFREQLDDMLMHARLVPYSRSYFTMLIEAAERASLVHVRAV